MALQHVQEFEKLLKRHNCRGLFCHTGKPAQVQNLSVLPVNGWRLSAASA
ncbi:hypothetical protein [Klebsiella pneumoniae]|nr:hypothetical protein [Klebsiella pneumoniae]